MPVPFPDDERFVDRTGKQFGLWTVVSYEGKRGYEGSHQWLCRCHCGKMKIVMWNNLARGASTSCGCFKMEKK